VRGEEGNFVERNAGFGIGIKHEDGPPEVARDHYEKWFAAIKSKSEPNDSYIADVGPHFED